MPRSGAAVRHAERLLDAASQPPAISSHSRSPFGEIVRLGLVMLSLPPGEPAVGPRQVEPVSALVRVLFEAAGPVQGHPRFVAVDGRGGSGKSTLAAQLHAAVPGSVVVHTDDVARAPLVLRLDRSAGAQRAGAATPGEGSPLPPAGLASQGQGGRDRGTRGARTRARRVSPLEWCNSGPSA